MRTTTLLTLLLLPLLLTAQEGFETRSIALFKNGLAFIEKTAKVSTDDKGRYRLSGELPEAKLGTFWLGTEGERFRYVRSFVDSVDFRRPAPNLIDALELNEGKEVTLSIQTTLDALYEVQGTLRGVLRDQVILETTAGQWQMWDAGSIRSIEFAEAPDYTLQGKRPERVVELQYAEPGDDKPLGMLYLTDGLSWMPNYLVQITAEGKARLTLRGQVVNERESAANADLYFVVGVPNFSYSNEPEPFLTDEPAVKLGQLEVHNLNPFRSQFSNYQAVAEAPTSYSYSPPPMELEGEASEDLFFYELKGVALTPGERALYDILSTEVDIEHVYRARLSNYGDNTAFAQADANTEEQRTPVNHTLRIKNEGKTPWTTGTALVLDAKGKRQRPVSQDRLNFTPPGGQVYLPVTTATDVYVTETAEELSRKPEALRWGGSEYDLLEIRGRIKLKNYRDKAIKLELEKTITGELKESSEDWDTLFLPNPRSSANRINKIEWALQLGPGAEKEIIYTYELYVRAY